MEPGIKIQNLHIGGMTCVNCQNRIEKKLGSLVGVQSAAVRYQTGGARVVYDPRLTSPAAIAAAVEKLGYTVLTGKPQRTGARHAAGLLLLIAALYVVTERLGILNLLAPSRLAEAGMDYGMLFVIGLMTSVHCLAMCGGINLSQCMAHAGAAGKHAPFAALRPSFLYNLGRVIAYTAVGFAVGAVGGVFTFSSGLQGALKLLAGACMVIMGVNMLGIFPGLRRLTPTMPRAVARRIHPEKGGSPLAVGLLNGLMPCGPLQAMQLYALSTGNPVMGALSMLLFSLGTVPLMFVLGAVGTMLTKSRARKIMAAGAVLVAVLGLSMLSQGWSLVGLSSAAPAVSAGQGTDAVTVEDGVQVVRSTLAPGRYPAIAVSAGMPVKWIIHAPEGSINGCNNRIFIPGYDIEHAFTPGENVITFTPRQAGVYRYSCWMGMIRSTITVQ